MRLSKLIHELSVLHEQLGNVEVICSADDEGNNFGIVQGAYKTFYVRDNDQAGPVVFIDVNWWIDVQEIDETEVEEYRD